MEIRTHQQIDPALCGRPVEVSPGRAEVALEITPRMAVDEHGLAHGGFVFGAADHAAMLAVNDPYVVLARADVKFLAPVAVGDRVVARARLVPGDDEGRTDRPEVAVEALVGERTVLSGVLRCAVLESHVLVGRADRGGRTDSPGGAGASGASGGGR